MQNPFVLLYELFESRKGLFYALLFMLLSAMLFFSLKLSLKEDISAFIPKDEKVKKQQDAIKGLKINNLLIFNIYSSDTSEKNPELLTEYANVLADSMRSRYDSTWLKEIKYKIDDETTLGIFDLLYDDLPYYLDSDDYKKIEKKLSDSSIYNKIKNNYETILSPEGIALKEYIIKDPLGLNNFALGKLAKLQSDENFELYNGYFLTKDRKNLFMYLSTGYTSNDSDRNGILVSGLYDIIDHLKHSGYPNIRAEFFGAPAVSVSNVKQIKYDSIITTLIALVIIFTGLIFYFRSFKTILLIFIPVIFGAVFSLAIVYLISNEISAIALGAGSIVLGIAMDYSLHFFTHLKHERSIKKVISSLTIPLTLGCTTTIGAFLCLHFMQSEALQDMGLFSALSLLGAVFCCLIVLPPLVKSFEKKDTTFHKTVFLDKITSYAYHKNKFLLGLVLILTVLFSFSYNKVGFETNLTKISYVTPELQQAENNLDKLINYKLTSVFLVSNATTLDEALRKNASSIAIVEKLHQENIVKKYSNVGVLLLSSKEKIEKVKKWKEFWSLEKVEKLKSDFYKYGKRFHFKETAFDQTLRLLEKEFNPNDKKSEAKIIKMFLQEYVNELENEYSVITTLKVSKDSIQKVYQAFEKSNETFVVDRGSMSKMVAKILNEDFNLIIILCAVLVFVFLFLSYGRIELALLAFLPMMISWVWILGIMGLSGFKFNIVNIIICTFIFGLGDDYSIFTIDGLEQQYKYGENTLASYRNSIFLSAFTTIVGIGVLIIAKHPALQSLAFVTIIGISCIVFISLIVQPFLYDVFILGRIKKRKLPITIYSLLFAFGSSVYFGLGLCYFKIAGLVFSKDQIKKHSLIFIRRLCSIVLFTERKLGEDLIVDILKKNISLIPYGNLDVFIKHYQQKRSEIPDTAFYRGKLIKNYIFKGPVLEWYTRIKTGLENNYKVFHELVPLKGKIFDVGCGYGYLSYMLSLTSDEREIVGIDYDEEKIRIAQNGSLRTEKLNFQCSDVLEYNYQLCDAIIINDVLHYLDEHNQELLIRKCLDHLKEDGIMIIRDGNSELTQRHKGTKLTEFFSTKIFKFNKVTISKLCFTSKEKILSATMGYPVSVDILDNTQFTSNMIFCIRKHKQ